MQGRRQIFVIDTNVLIDYPDIIPDEKGETHAFENPLVDMTDAHLVIPSAVFRELSSFKDERGVRGYAGRAVPRNARWYFEKAHFSMEEAYRLGATVTLPDGRLLSILPIDADFKRALPFRPSEDDMDGQIILATLATMYLAGAGDVSKIEWQNAPTWGAIRLAKNVTLLTNDNVLALRAMERGIKTSRYGHALPTPYTGRRDVIVPRDIFWEFYEKKRLGRDLWEEFLPEEEMLVANEFIVMRLEDPGEYPAELVMGENQYFRHIGRYDLKKDAIVGLRYASQAPFSIRSDGQAMYAEALLDPEIAAVICTGPAGSGKTYLPTIYGLSACQEGKYTDIVVVPCADLSHLGALPGDLNEKMSLDVGPLRNALRNYLLENDSKVRRELDRIQKAGISMYADAEDGEEEVSFNDRLQSKINNIWHRFFRNIPVEKARGLDFLKELTLYDEFQDQSPRQADMLLKRLGKDGKIVITGDVKQIHAPYLDESNNGITYATNLLYDTPMVARVSLLKDEVERHELVKLIAERQSRRKVSAPPRAPIDDG